MPKISFRIVPAFRESISHVQTGAARKPDRCADLRPQAAQRSGLSTARSGATDQISIPATITLPDGTRRYATFMTLGVVSRVMKRRQDMGECLNGPILLDLRLGHQP
ncbi:hypothetical protein ACIBK1_03995 [Microbispora rosea]|uniref:hypothetical protein n=1 Tax=Microbispora rosea TaxID=58117 RepID=UPI0037BD85FD